MGQDRPVQTRRTLLASSQKYQGVNLRGPWEIPGTSKLELGPDLPGELDVKPQVTERAREQPGD